MPQTDLLHSFLGACSIEPAVLALRPDYRALLMVVEGLEPSTASPAADQLVARAEAHARTLLAASPVEALPHIASWREAYRAFGAKPQRTRNSLEALTRRAEKGLPRVNALTDIYNAVSVLHQIPLGGEDLERYEGAARLLRATGKEPFEVMSNGETAVESPDPGEVVWCDDAGVTCRRWNWRQGPRTGLRDQTRTAFFILDALSPVTDEELTAGADVLAQELSVLGTEVRVSRRLLQSD